MSVCVQQWLIHWFHNTMWLDLCECWTSANTLWHQIRQTSLSPPSPLNLITPFQFSLSSFLLLLYSIYLPPSSHLSLNSCSEVSFPSPRLHFLSCFPIFLFFFPPPLTQITDDPTSTCTKHTHTWKWLKARCIQYMNRYLVWTSTYMLYFSAEVWIASGPEMKTH